MRLKDFVTTWEAAQMFHVTYKTVGRWCEEGRLIFETTEGGHRRIPRAAIMLKLGATENAR